MVGGAARDLWAQDAGVERLADGAVVLRAYARSQVPQLLQAIGQVTLEAPLRHMTTPGGFRMSVAMTNCGGYGWITDRTGYRYEHCDPLSGRPWPALPHPIAEVAIAAAAHAGYPGFVPDACLINRYEPGARMSLHQDKNERDLEAPIVSVSLGLPATFLFGGRTRGERPRRVPLESGDVVVWGGPSRLFFHGVAPLADGVDALTGGYRFNLTLRASQ
jgi:DNA oxidative demethylase